MLGVGRYSQCVQRAMKDLIIMIIQYKLAEGDVFIVVGSIQRLWTG